MTYIASSSPFVAPVSSPPFAATASLSSYCESYADGGALPHWRWLRALAAVGPIFMAATLLSIVLGGGLAEPAALAFGLAAYAVSLGLVLLIWRHPPSTVPLMAEAPTRGADDGHSSAPRGFAASEVAASQSVPEPCVWLPEVPLLDIEALGALAGDIDAEHLPQIIDVFIEGLVERSNRIRSMIASGDTANASFECSALTSIGETVGARRLTEQLRLVEAACRADIPDEALVQMGVALKLVDATVAALAGRYVGR
ncbi:MAG: hypothetical protein GC191_06370 [Azospirillum sp.]|nr:hypothetical protein [Azospirillum sp.]